MPRAIRTVSMAHRHIIRRRIDWIRKALRRRLMGYKKGDKVIHCGEVRTVQSYPYTMTGGEPGITLEPKPGDTGLGSGVCLTSVIPIKDIKMAICPEYVWQRDIAMQLKGPILIVGVSGFIGASLYKHLKRFREDIYGCSRQPYSWRNQEE